MPACWALLAVSLRSFSSRLPFLPTVSETIYLSSPAITRTAATVPTRRWHLRGMCYRCVLIQSSKLHKKIPGRKESLRFLFSIVYRGNTSGRLVKTKFTKCPTTSGEPRRVQIFSFSRSYIPMLTLVLLLIPDIKPPPYLFLEIGLIRFGTVTSTCWHNAVPYPDIPVS
jgi:hypothetical protein